MAECGAEMPEQYVWLGGPEVYRHTDTCTRERGHHSPWHQGELWVWAKTKWVTRPSAAGGPAGEG